VSALRTPTVPACSASAGPLRLRWVLALLLLVAASCGSVQEQHGTNQSTGAAGEATVDAGLGAAAADGGPGRDAVGAPDTAALEIVFFDVGQGDAVLIRAPTGQAVLYDGGEGRVDLLPKLRGLGVGELSLVIASHNHADHIGGLPDVIRFYRPRFVMDNGVPHTTRAYERFLQAIEAAGSQLLEPTRRSIRLGEAELLVLPPPGRPAWGHNDNSVGLIVRYGDFRASLTGDAEHRQWEWWLANQLDLLEPVQVHKASHHGSRNGDTPGAIRALRPEAVVIGLAAGNTYGHPHEEALALYRSVDATVYRTDRDGRVTVQAWPSGAFRVRTASTTAVAPVSPHGGCVGLNGASAAELRRIMHIDEERAEQIVRLRRERPFRSVAEITRIQGIGQGRARDVQDQGLACVAP